MTRSPVPVAHRPLQNGPPPSVGIASLLAPLLSMAAHSAAAPARHNTGDAGQATLGDHHEASRPWQTSALALVQDLVEGTTGLAGAADTVASHAVGLAGADLAVMCVPSNSPVATPTLAEVVAELLGTDVPATLARPEFSCFARGVGAYAYGGPQAAGGDSVLHRVLHQRTPRSFPDLHSVQELAGLPRWADPRRPCLLVPVATGDLAVGTLALLRPKNAAPFSSSDEHAVSAFARHAAIGVQLLTMRRQQIAEHVDAQSSAIALDLHDRALQGVYAAGLTLQAVQRRHENNPDICTRLEGAIHELDAAITSLRGVISALPK